LYFPSDIYRTQGKRTALTEILPPNSKSNKQDLDVSVDEEDLPLHLQETGLHVGSVSEFERGLAVIANRKKDEDNRKKAKMSSSAAKENQGVDVMEKQPAKRKRVGGVRGSKSARSQ
jgi:hypothetical protein